MFMILWVLGTSNCLNYGVINLFLIKDEVLRFTYHLDLRDI